MSGADNNRRTKTMRTVRIKVYKFSELSESVKNKVIENYYKNEDYPLLEDSLNESCMALLEENVSPEKEEALKKIYFDICSKLEKEGYETLEYRMSHEEFSQLSDENLYEYTQDGELFVK